MAASAQHHRILVLDEFRELPDGEWEEFRSKWESKGATFMRYNTTTDKTTTASSADAPPKSKADEPVSKEDAFGRLKKLDQEHGPFTGLISLQGFLHKYKPIDGEFLDALPSVRFLTGAGAGFDNIDTQALSSRGVYYCNTPDAVSTPTADSASILILAVLKNIIFADRNVRKGRWGTDVPFGMNPKGATLGIWGMGSIGRITSRQMQAFGMKVVYHNRHRLPEEKEGGARYIEKLEDFLGQCDVVSLHVPLSSATRHLVSAKEFAMFKKGARFVNTARGPVCHEEVLVDALKSGHLSGAALDVFEFEPKVHPWLLEADNVLLQPHTGSHTAGTFAEVTREMLSNLDSFLSAKDGQVPHNAVNRPEGQRSKDTDSSSKRVLKVRLRGV